MPISAKEALDKANTLELNKSEGAWFEKLCLYTDYHISNYFDGESVRISFKNMFITSETDKRTQVNCGPQPHQLPHWRQDAVIKIWIKTYEDLGWRITEKKTDMYPEFTFEPDKRDMRLKEVLS